MDSPDRIPLPEAARRAGVTPTTVRNWGRKVPGLARKVMGRWWVDPAVLARVTAGGA